MNKMRPIVNGFIGTVALLTVYFSIVSFVSGFAFALEQFSKFWYYIIALTVGFGVQIALYTYLRRVVRHAHGSAGALAVSGTTSTTAMISCCTHYLANILPIIGISGVAAFIGQYQIQLFWVGLAFNIFGIAYIGNKVLNLPRL